MKRSEVDYNKYDILDIYAKEDKVETITKCYESFCWELIEKNENSKYADTVELTFIRPHKIPQKDYLLYTQIEMENTLNSLGKLDRKTYAKSTSISLFLGVLTLCIIVLGSKLFAENIRIFGVVLIALGIVAGVFTAIIGAKLHAIDERNFEKEQNTLSNNLKSICKSVHEKVVKDDANKD